MYEKRVVELDRLLVVPSKSRYELELAKYGSEDAAQQRYRAGRRWDVIRDSHFRQKENLQRVVNVLGDAQVVDRAALTVEAIRNHDLFVFLGGDNHFTYCSQKILQYAGRHPEEKFVMGVVLDPEKSFGGILYFDVDTFLQALPVLGKEGFAVENWTTLEAKVDQGTQIVQPHNAVSEFFVGEYSRLFMSRSDVFEQRVYVDGKQVLPEKSSGIIVAAGSGTGHGSWYDNIHKCYFGVADELGKEDESARIICSEHESRAKTTLLKGQTLVIDSYNDGRGIVSPDSHEEHSAEFGMGSQVEIRISDLKLKVARR